MGYEADLKLFIDGSWRAGEDRDHFTVVNPVTGSGIAELPLATKADLEEALAAAEREPGRNGARPTSRSAARSSTRPPICCASGPSISAAILTQEQGKIFPEAKAEVLGSGATVRLVRRGDQARLRPHPGPPGRASCRG